MCLAKKMLHAIFAYNKITTDMKWIKNLTLLRKHVNFVIIQAVFQICINLSCFLWLCVMILLRIRGGGGGGVRVTCRLKWHPCSSHHLKLGPLNGVTCMCRSKFHSKWCKVRLKITLFLKNNKVLDENTFHFISKSCKVWLKKYPCFSNMLMPP